jgi:hypothetical protein
VRPTRILPGTKSPLEGCKIGDLDWMIIRENSEGEYSGQGGISHGETEHAVATEVSIVCATSLPILLYFHFLLKDGEGCLSSQLTKGPDNRFMIGAVVLHSTNMPGLHHTHSLSTSKEPQLTPHPSSPKSPSRESSTSPSLPHAPAPANT